jgi:hypothetical protein
MRFTLLEADLDGKLWGQDLDGGNLGEVFLRSR